jgi:hypothetical protein
MDKAYEDLLNEYRVELHDARSAALTWWSKLEQAAALVDPGNVEAQIRPRWPAGPASYPRVIAVYRKYFLACERLNEEREAGEEPEDQLADAGTGWGEDDEEDDPEATTVHPPTLLFGALEEVDPELARFMESFVFSPMGIDPDGETV